MTTLGLLDPLFTYATLSLKQYLMLTSTCTQWNTNRFSRLCAKDHLLGQLFSKVVLADADRLWNSLITFLFPNTHDVADAILNQFTQNQYDVPLCLTLKTTEKFDEQRLDSIRQKFPTITEKWTKPPASRTPTAYFYYDTRGRFFYR